VLPELDIFGLPVKTFGLALIAAFVVATIVVAKRLDELGRPAAWASEIVFVSFTAGMAGAYAGWLLSDFPGLADDPLGQIVEGGGLVWYTGLLAGAGVGTAWAAWRGMLELRLLDVALTATAAALAIGRIGCQLAGDGDYGIPSELPWAMGYPDGVVPTPPGVTVHPTPIYEALLLGAIAIWMWRKRDAYRPGVIAAAYFVLTGAERFLVEFVRRNDEVLAGLTQAQIWSVASIIVGVVGLLVIHRRHPVGGLRAA
jgi:phosphatidylglycerol:prolipoprotein diacylglycerol transferase